MLPVSVGSGPALGKGREIPVFQTEQGTQCEESFCSGQALVSGWAHPGLAWVWLAGSLSAMVAWVRAQAQAHVAKFSRVVSVSEQRLRHCCVEYAVDARSHGCYVL